VYNQENQPYEKIIHMHLYRTSNQYGDNYNIGSNKHSRNYHNVKIKVSL